MVALLPCDFAVLLLRDAVCFPIPLNQGSLCFCFGRVMLCNFQAWPLPGLAAAASCLLEARHHAMRTPTLRPQCSESPHLCVSGAGGWDTLWGEKKQRNTWKWILQPTLPRLSPHIAEMNCPGPDCPKCLIYEMVAQLKPLSFGSGLLHSQRWLKLRILGSS